VRPLDYERRDPRRPRPSFWESEAGGFVQMVICLAVFFLAGAILWLMSA
jgi:hypothetical protein